jgi:predicted metalloprotease with PDZ domain
MHWLTEGLTSFVDDLFVLNCDLSTDDYFLKSLAKKMNTYIKTPGRFFDSLEEGSFDAWIKLYRPNENSRNATVSYYLKGALAFFCLNSLLNLQGRSLKEFTSELWDRYKLDPSTGMTKEEVLKIIYSLAGVSIGEEFESFISDTGELPLEESCERSGIKVHWHQPEGLDWGGDLKSRGENIYIENIRLDGPAHKCGLNHGDEIIGSSGQRLQSSILASWQKSLKKGQVTNLLISRQGYLLEIEVVPEAMPKEIEKLTITNPELFSRVLKSL